MVPPPWSLGATGFWGGRAFASCMSRFCQATIVETTVKNMTRFIMWAVTLLTTVVTTSVWTEPPSSDKANEAVLIFLAGHQIQGMNERLQEIIDPALTRIFPSQRFLVWHRVSPQGTAATIHQGSSR